MLKNTTAAPSPAGPGHGAWSVFLSSTIDDLAQWRQEVVEVLQNRVGAACDDCQQWVGGFEDVEIMCRQQLSRANAYILLLGHWYGSVPPGSNRSITQIEFECALERWHGTSSPRMAVMVPKLDSDADRELRLNAQRIVDERRLDSAAHAGLIENFRGSVIGSWRKVNFFSDRQELREYTIVVGTTWRSGGFADAARGATAATEPEVPVIRDADLGSLGRGIQLDDLKKVLAALRIGKHPALAVLVHGGSAAAQRPFLAHLVQGPLRAFKPQGRGMRLPHACLDLAALCAWVAQSLGLPPGGDHTAASVAERAAAKLRERPLCLMLDGVGRFDGGAATFHSQFWKPFFDRLVAEHERQRFTHRLLAVLSDYTGEPQAWDGVARTARQTNLGDGSLLVALPMLENFSEDDVTLWLAEMNFADEPSGHLEQVARRVVTDDQDQLDLIPMKVLDRLRGEDLRPLEDDT